MPLLLPVPGGLLVHHVLHECHQVLGGIACEMAKGYSQAFHKAYV